MSVNVSWLVRGGGPWWFRWSIRLMMLAGIVACGFLSYNHEVGGRCRVAPLAERGIRAQIDGEIVEVHVREGEWVSPGQLIATLALHDEESMVATTTAQLETARATLKKLRNGATPEDITIAEQKVEIARVEVEFAQTELARVEELVSQSAAAGKELEKARQKRDLAIHMHLAAKEELQKVRDGAREEDIQAAEAEVRRLEAELSHSQLLVTFGKLTAPIAGRIVTANIEERAGQYVREGDLIATINDDSELTVQVAADESAAVLVEPGMAVDVRLNGMDGKSLRGKVIKLSPAMVDELEEDRIRTDRELLAQSGPQDPESYHTLIYVTIDEQYDKLRPGMTGQARVVVNQGLLWESVARPVRRFLYVDVWSWLP